MIEDVLVQGVRNLQVTDEHECRNVLTAVGDFDELALKEADVGLEDITLPHLNGEEMMDIFLGLLVRGILSEKHLGYLLEIGRERAVE